MKKWYLSKTVLLNILAAVAVIIQAITGNTWLDAEAQAAIVVVANLILRIFTNQGLTK
ncbi:MAG: hypothetical protein KAS32_04970 [Candidatus Peribacteraceae bacterium]|nr:hypothetical protein [Candidatus Peribacteraceae bacterium]